MNKGLKITIEIIVVLIVIAAGYIGFRTISGVAKKDGVEKEVVITLEAQGYKEDFLTKISIGDKIIENKRKTYFGEVIDVMEITPYTKIAEDYTKNEYLEIPVEDYYNRFFIVKAKVNVTEKDIKIGENVIKVGDQWPVKSTNYALHGLITSIEIQ